MDQKRKGGRKRRANSNLFLGYLTCHQIPYLNTYKILIWISSLRYEKAELLKNNEVIIIKISFFADTDKL